MSVKLYELKRESLFKIVGDPSEEVFTFVKIDGAYSIITDVNNVVGHLSAWADVDVVETL